MTQFTANGTLYDFTETDTGWCWEVPVSPTSYAVIRDSGKSFATAAEAQQDALRDAAIDRDEEEDGEYETTADLRRELSPRVL